jgi:expansin (peptidoglycan-binding protein)
MQIINNNIFRIRNSAIPVVKLEIFGDFGWTNIPRSNFNYFILSDPGPGPYKLRATSKFGESIVEESVPLLNGTLFEGKTQFRNGTLDSTAAYDSLLESDMD